MSLGYNDAGYRDSTASAAIALANRRKNSTQTGPVVTKQIPLNNHIYFQEDQRMSTRIYDVYMHYRGYHNPDMGEWISVRAESVEDAKTRALSIPLKKPAEILIVRRRTR